MTLTPITNYCYHVHQRIEQPTNKSTIQSQINGSHPKNEERKYDGGITIKHNKISR